MRKATRLPLDVHLMIVGAGALRRAFAKAGADCITVHAEACPHLHRTLQQIRQLGAKRRGGAQPLHPAVPGGTRARHRRPGPGDERQPRLRRAGLHPVGRPEDTGAPAEMPSGAGSSPVIEVDGGINEATAREAAQRRGRRARGGQVRLRRIVLRAGERLAQARLHRGLNPFRPGTDRFRSGAGSSRRAFPARIRMDYKETLNLPETAFPMKGNLATREPEILRRWEEEGLYDAILSTRQGSAAVHPSRRPSLRQRPHPHGPRRQQDPEGHRHPRATMAGSARPYVPGLGLPRPAHRAPGGQGAERRQEGAA